MQPEIIRFQTITLLLALAFNVLIVCPVPARAAPQNIILMIGDGMGFEHLKQAGYRDTSGRWTPPFTCFSVQLKMTTWALGPARDGHWDTPPPMTVTDSAAAATALATGRKTFNGVLGMVPDQTGRLRPVVNLMEAAEQNGLSTGVVTSVPFSHATPAAFAAHTADRGDKKNIARQMLSLSKLDVIAGAGHPHYDDNGRRLRLRSFFGYVGGRDLWRDIVAGKVGNDADGDGTIDPWTLVDSTAAIRAMARGPTPKRLLLLAPVASTLQQRRSGPAAAAADAVPFSSGVPTLADLALTAINRLEDDPDGFVLMIEGGAIDWAGHANQSGRMIEELDDFARTLAMVEQLITERLGWEHTLLLVTADHETGGLETLGWTTRHHTGAAVPLLARGQGAEQLFALPGLEAGVIDNSRLGSWLIERVGGQSQTATTKGQH